MNNADYKKALASIDTETKSLLEQRAAIDTRLLQLKTVRESLSVLLEAPIEETVAEGLLEMYGEIGITDAIRRLLKDKQRPLTPVQIRDGLVAAGFELGSYASALAVIHTTLKRLERQREVVAVKGPDGPAAYAFLRPQERSSIFDTSSAKRSR